MFNCPVFIIKCPGVSTISALPIDIIMAAVPAICLNHSLAYSSCDCCVIHFQMKLMQLGLEVRFVIHDNLSCPALLIPALRREFLTLGSGCTFGLFLGGTFDPLRPRPAGISVVASLVMPGTFLAFINHLTKSSSS